MQGSRRLGRPAEPAGKELRHEDGALFQRGSHVDALSGRALSRSFLLLTGGACLAAGEEDVGGEDEIVALLSSTTLRDSRSFSLQAASSWPEPGFC